MDRRIGEKDFSGAMRAARRAGGEAVDEAINQITRAASILKGATTTEALLEQLKGIR